MENSRWGDVEELLSSCAGSDLEQLGEVGPALVALRGEHLQFVAWLRPFDKGRYHDPLIELLALAMPLDVDRLALSIAGRAWSLEDPIPPVTEETDLRQRVHIMYLCDGSDGKPRMTSVLRPFELEGSSLRWGREQRTDDVVEGWVPEVLMVAVKDRRKLRAPLSEIRWQAIRVSALGHELFVSPELGERLRCVPESQR